MINYIAQRIGVYYKEEHWAKEFLDYLLKSIPEQAIVGRRRDRIDLVDGSFIKTVKVGSDTRGYRFDKIFIQSGIDEEIYQTEIKPYYVNRFRYLVFNDYLNDCPIDADLYYGLNKKSAEGLD